MRQLPLGNTGVQVSAFCLGTMNFGGTTSEQVARDILDLYVERGGYFLDTANIYSYGRPNCVGGESETILGSWIKDRGNRSKMFVATKVGMEYPGVQSGLRAHQIESECEKSLKRLGIDTIDLYYAHADDRNTPLEESLAAFDRLIKAGKVRFIGASNFLTWRLVESHWVSRTQGLAEYCCIQQRYSYLRPKAGAKFRVQVATDDGLLDYCRTQNFPLIGYAPLLKGAVASRPDKKLGEHYAGVDSNVRLAALKSMAGETGASAVQIVLAWMKQSDAPIIPLFSASTVEQMEENLGALDVQLSPDQMARLDAASA